MWTVARYAVVSALGAIVQLATVVTLGHATPLHPTTIAFLSVAAAVLHNFAWHERWTWRSRTRHAGSAWARLAAYASSNGLVSAAAGMIAAALITPTSVGAAGASVIAITAAGALNYWMARKFIWSTRRLYSPRSAVNGSTRAARTAGAAAASAATPTNIAVATANVAGSRGDRPYSSAATDERPSQATARPATQPTATTQSASRSTIQQTASGADPNASRTPISFVRRETAYESVP